MRFINDYMLALYLAAYFIAALTHKPTIQDRKRHSSCLLDVKPFTEAHLICQAGFLAYGSNVCLPLLTCL